MIRQGLWIKIGGFERGAKDAVGEGSATGQAVKRTEILLDQDAGERIATAAAFLAAVPATGFWSWTSAR